MKIWKIAGVLGLVVLALGVLGVGMVFAQTMVPNVGPNSWSNMMGAVRLQSTLTPGTGMMGGTGSWTGRGAMMNGTGNMMGQGGMMDADDMGPIHDWMMGPNGMHTQVLTDLAKTLNLTLEDLQSQLKSGKSLTQIAQAQGVSQSQLETALETSVKDNLSKAVSAGKLTQQQADQMLSHMNGNYALMLDMTGSGMMAGGAGGCHRNGNATPTETPNL
jgi:hypothetical protein